MHREVLTKRAAQLFGSLRRFLVSTSRVAPRLPTQFIKKQRLSPDKIRLRYLTGTESRLKTVVTRPFSSQRMTHLVKT
jgi:hypothetical protein